MASPEEIRNSFSDGPFKGAIIPGDFLPEESGFQDLIDGFNGVGDSDHTPEGHRRGCDGNCNGKCSVGCCKK